MTLREMMMILMRSKCSSTIENGYLCCKDSRLQRLDLLIICAIPDVVLDVGIK